MKEHHKWINNDTWQKKLCNILPLLGYLASMVVSLEFTNKQPYIVVLTLIGSFMLRVECEFIMIRMRTDEKDKRETEYNSELHQQNANYPPSE